MDTDTSDSTGQSSQKLIQDIVVPFSRPHPRRWRRGWRRRWRRRWRRQCWCHRQPWTPAPWTPPTQSIRISYCSFSSKNWFTLSAKERLPPKRFSTTASTDSLADIMIMIMVKTMTTARMITIGHDNGGDDGRIKDGWSCEYVKRNRPGRGQEALE